MAVKFMDGFGVYDSIAEVPQKWDATSIMGNSAFATSRTPGIGGNALQFRGSQLKTPDLGDQATWVVGFAYQNIDRSGTPFVILRFNDDDTTQIDLRLDSSTKLLSVVSDGTTLGTGTTPILNNTWYYIEMKVTISNTSGSVHLKVNESTDINLSTQDTQASANATANKVVFVGSNAAVSNLIDDLYILDTTGSENTDFLGDMKIETITADSNGTSTDWLASPGFANFLCIQDGTNGGSLTSNTPDEISQAGFTNLLKVDSDIKAVAINIQARNSDSTGHVLADSVRQNSTDFEGTNINVSSTAYNMIHSIREVDPDTTVSWTVNGIASAEFGAKLIS